MDDDIEPIECNLPEMTACNCELSDNGRIPTTLERLECKMRGGPCRETCVTPESE